MSPSAETLCRVSLCHTGNSKQLTPPRWQAGPSGSTSTTSASRSQSAVTETRCCTLPLVSPLRQSSCLERDQKTVRSSFRDSARLSRFM